jgi:pimeloyl-ACP methyl ester carboxylesterase
LLGEIPVDNYLKILEYKHMKKRKLIKRVIYIIMVLCLLAGIWIIMNMEKSAAEKVFVEINGLRQGMFIESRDTNAPVLLFLHGGPGFPIYGMTKKYPTRLDEIFTVCWWEQRGAGISYNKNINPNDITIENIVSDAIEVTHYLQRRFNKEKIYLMSQSGGTFIGINLVNENPELFYAYIAVEQMVNQLESEKIAYSYMMEQYENTNNKKMIKRMEENNILSLDIIPKKYAEFRDKPMHELGIGSMHSMKSVVTGIFLPVMANNAYTFSERINIWKAKSMYYHKTNLWEVISKTIISDKITSIDIPVYFFHGIYDYTVNYSLAKEYFQLLDSPLKGFYTFENSAHSPIFEEPEKIIKILLEDLLRGNTNNSDKI